MRLRRWQRARARRASNSAVPNDCDPLHLQGSSSKPVCGKKEATSLLIIACRRTSQLGTMRVLFQTNTSRKQSQGKDRPCTMPPKRTTAVTDNESKQSALSSLAEDKDWRNCIAKMVIYEDLVSGTIPLDEKDMSAAEVFDFYQGEEAFHGITFEPHFTGRLQRLRDKVKMKNDHSERDALALAQDRAIYPRRTHSINHPYWAVSKARELLEKDIQNNVHTTFKNEKGKVSREKFWKSRAAYQEFDLDEFRGHVYQQIKTVKFQNYVKTKVKENKDKGFAQQVAK